MKWGSEGAPSQGNLAEKIGRWIVKEAEIEVARSVGSGGSGSPFKEKRPPFLNLHKMDSSDHTPKSLLPTKSDRTSTITKGGTSANTKTLKRVAIERTLDSISRCGKETILLDNLDLSAAEDEEKKERRRKRSPEAKRLTQIFNQFFKTPEPQQVKVQKTIVLQGSPTPSLKSALKRKSTIKPAFSPPPRVS